MKRLFYIAAAAMAVLSACTKENPIVEVGTEPESVSMPVFKATIEGPATKTTLGEGNKVNWENGDEVLMMFGTEDDGASAAYIYEATPDVDASSATLAYKSDVLVLDPAANILIMAVYPASMVSLTEGMVFPATQTYNGDGKIPIAPMVYMGDLAVTNIEFKNAASLLKITVPYAQMHSVSSITVSSNLVMNGVVSYDTNGYFYIDTEDCGPVSDENSKLTLNCGNVAIPEGESKTFYISILPLSSETTGKNVQAQCYEYLQIDVTDGETTKRMRTNNPSGIQVERNKIYPINFSENYVVTAAWENALTLGRSFSGGATSIEIQTGVNVSSYTVDATHKSLNAAGTLWEVLDGEVLRIQTSADKIIAPVNSFGLFRNYYKVESIANLNKLDMSGVTDMSRMFADCYALTSIALPVNTGSVTDMNHMFYNCEKLQSITGIDNLNTGSVTNMSGMFRGCPALSALDVTHFDTQNVTDMSGMFYSCQTVALDVTHFDTQNVTDMSDMFCDCHNLSALDVTHFDTQNVTDMSYMFASCQSLSALDVTHFDTQNVTNMSGMFDNCEALESLDITSFDTGSVENMERMFSMCTNLTSLRIGKNFSMSKVTDKWDMFAGCGSGGRSFYVYAVNNDDWELEFALSDGTGWVWYMQFEQIWE